MPVKFNNSDVKKHIIYEIVIENKGNINTISNSSQEQ